MKPRTRPLLRRRLKGINPFENPIAIYSNKITLHSFTFFELIFSHYTQINKQIHNETYGEALFGAAIGVSSVVLLEADI